MLRNGIVSDGEVYSVTKWNIVSDGVEHSVM